MRTLTYVNPSLKLWLISMNIFQNCVLCKVSRIQFKHVFVYKLKVNVTLVLLKGIERKCSS